MDNKYMAYFGLFLWILTIGLSWYWFGYKLPIILFLLSWANNVDKSLKEK